MSERIKKLRSAIETMHACGATHVSSRLVVERFRDKIAWDGVVEIFDLQGHPKAKRCFAWSYVENNDVQYVTVLEIPPVDSAESAVKVAIASEGKRQAAWLRTANDPPPDGERTE